MHFNLITPVNNQTVIIDKNKLGSSICDSYSIIIAGEAASVKYKVDKATLQVDLGTLTGQHKLDVGRIVEFEVATTGNSEVIIQGF